MMMEIQQLQQHMKTIRMTAMIMAMMVLIMMEKANKTRKRKRKRRRKEKEVKKRRGRKATCIFTSTDGSALLSSCKACQATRS